MKNWVQAYWGRRKKRLLIGGAVFFTTLIVWLTALPDPLFREPYSTVLEDRQEKLLSASIARDGQWRFPEGGEAPDKFSEALITFEDKRFRHHPGIDVLSLGRAIRQNISAGKVVSGGSTLSMQVIRLSRKGKSRTFAEKFVEFFLATRLELRYSKKEILELYAAHAPFGGNVVGIEAACWRYFSRGSSSLSWSEAALLAVLPNNPSLIHPGKNRQRLKTKRDRLLLKLRDAGTIDALTADLAIAESIPESPQALPRHARHLLDRIAKEGYAQKRLVSTVDLVLQQHAEEILDRHYQRLKGNQVFNAAAFIMDVRTGNVLAYAGNTDCGAANQSEVDVITAHRSTGSILKPFLFAAMLEEGKMLSKTLWQDVPTTIDGFSPRNFSREYDGAVSADKALIRSLNIPAVHELREYRYEKFYEVLRHAGLTTLTKFPDHYGLTLVLGGAEGSLWDITGAYASMARSLANFSGHPGKNKYDPSDYHPPRYDTAAANSPAALEEHSFLSAGAIWQTFETLKEVYRPGEETGWRFFNSSKKIAWKTGTSFGFRDGWAVGVNPDYAVGVWTGNADGEGRPGLTGTEAAAPILFDLFSVLPGQPWFQQPLTEMTKIATCSKSGQRISAFCSDTTMSWVVTAGLATPVCEYHRMIHVTADEKFRVHSACEDVGKMKSISWFVLPPLEEYYYKSKNIRYKTLPPFRKGCENPASIVSVDVLYPRQGAKIYIPRELDGTAGSTVFEATHRSAAAILYWHVDGNFIGTSRKNHRMPINSTKGDHILTLVDDHGETVTRNFSILSSP